MKLATLRDGSRDGLLVVVDRAMEWAVPVPSVARTLQEALDDWPRAEPWLEEYYWGLNEGGVPGELRFNVQDALAPLPRVPRWLDGNAYLNHLELRQRLTGATVPDHFYRRPQLWENGNSICSGPRESILAGAEERWPLGFDAAVAAITASVPMGASRQEAAAAIRLFVLVNGISLHDDLTGEQLTPLSERPQTSLSPVAVNPRELGDAWDGGRLHLPLLCSINGTELGNADAGEDMEFDFPELIARAARSRLLPAGTVITAGAVSNRKRESGLSSLLEKRMRETLDRGKPQTPFLRTGDRVHVDMLDRRGQSVFGAIDQQVTLYRRN